MIDLIVFLTFNPKPKYVPDEIYTVTIPERARLFAGSGLRKSMGLANRKLIEKKLSWDVLAIEYVDAWRKVMGR